jgi:hypothetical protein
MFRYDTNAKIPLSNTQTPIPQSTRMKKVKESSKEGEYG